MPKQMMNKKGSSVILFLLVLGIMFIPYNVKAENDADTTKCKTKIVQKISIKESGADKTTKTISVTTPDIGEYTVLYKIANYLDDVADFGNDSNGFTTLGQNEDGTFKTISLAPGKEIYVIVKLKSDYKFKNSKGKVTDVCNNPGTIKVNSDGTLSATRQKKKTVDGKEVTYTVAGTYKTKKIQNPPNNHNITSEETYEKKACDLMRRGIYKNDGTSSDDDVVVDAGYTNFASSYFPYCYQKNVSIPFTLSNKVINYVRHKLITIYKDTQSDFNQGKIVVSPGFENILPSKSTDLGTLKCNKFPAYDPVLEEDEHNVQRFVYENTKDVKHDDVTVCKVKCREELEVTYGPPVATKAGLCFTYEVTVKTKVQCETDMNENSLLKKPNFCGPYPICEHGTNQAGPSEEFDSCIKECDGGEYSQSCINKCYKKVYGDKEVKTTKTSTETEEDASTSVSVLTYNDKETSVIRSIADNDDPYNIEGCKNNTEIMANLDTCAKKLTEAKAEKPYGSYVYSNGSFNWKSTYNGSYEISKNTASSIIKSIKRSSPFYTNSVANTKSLIQSIVGYTGNGVYKRYIIDDNGIKRQYSWRWQCAETCTYKGCKSSDAYSNEEAYNDYFKYLEEYEKVVAECKAAASCETKTSTFTIDVNKDEETTWNSKNSTNDDNSDHRSGDTLMFTPQFGDATIDPFDGINGICYAGRKMQWQHYKTTITFPGTWINLKNGARVYKEPSNENQYKKKTNYFCVGYDEEPVNEDWWDWRVNDNGDPTKTAGVTVENDKNITATIRDFGKFGWNIDINCFYALSNVADPDDPSTSTVPYDECSNGNSTELCNAEFRPINQQNMFPSKDGTGSRDAGFNWTNAATDYTAAGTTYGIKPGDYAKELQDAAATNPDISYTGTADYEVHLTKDNIKKIRNYVDENGYTSYLCNDNDETYNNCYQKVENVDGLYFYTSKFLKDTSYVSSFTRKDSLLGKNND